MESIPEEVREVRNHIREFINEKVVPVEPILHKDDEGSVQVLESLKQQAKDEGIWALGHPTEIGGGGLPFMSFVYLNEIIGRSHWGQAAVGSLTMQDSIMLNLYGSETQKERWLKPLVAGEILPSVGLTEDRKSTSETPVT